MHVLKIQPYLEKEVKEDAEVNTETNAPTDDLENLDFLFSIPIQGILQRIHFLILYILTVV